MARKSLNKSKPVAIGAEALADLLLVAADLHKWFVLRRRAHSFNFWRSLDEVFGGAKAVGGMAQTMYRGVERVQSRSILTMAANTPAKLPRLPAV